MDLRRFRTLARNWEALGDEDPFFGVLSDASKRDRKWDRDEFFASGRAHVDNLLRTVTNARAGFVPGTCLDFGCGVGRLTLPLSEHFQWTVGVDVARSMIEAARRHRPAAGRCEFVLNADPDLRRFKDDSFDLVHSSLVLQHIAPDISLRYIGEFVRVCKPGGLVVFQLPAAARSPNDTGEPVVLPDAAFSAQLEVVMPLPAFTVSALASLRIRVSNRSPVTWRHDAVGGRPINVGNHWLDEDGRPVIGDDGRAALPDRVDPGVTVEIPLTVRAPEMPGVYILEVDLVQEHVCWFNSRGSATARGRVVVAAEPSAPREIQRSAPTDGRVEPRTTTWSVSTRGGALLRRLLGRIRGAKPAFEMHVVPRAEVEQALEAARATVLCIVDDNAAGPGWLSYTYVARKHA